MLELYPHEISGGMRQRVLIAMAFACDPSLVIADEPTTALDVTVQRQVLQLVERLRQRHGAAMLFVTHDLGVVAKICHTMTVLHAGRVLEEGETADVLAKPRHPYTRALLAATPRADRPADALRPVPPALIESLWSGGASVRPASRGGVRHERHPAAHRQSEFRLSGAGVGARSGGRPMREVVKRVDLAVPRGSVLGLVGESGSGKTTLGRLLVRLLRPTSGGIQFDGIEIGDLGEADLRPLRARIQMIFQDPQSSLNPRLRLGVTLTRPLQVFGRLKGRPRCARARRGAARSGRAADQLSSIAIRTSSRAASASAPGSPVRWRSSRTSSSPTRSCPASTSRPRRISCCCSRSCAQRLGLTLVFISHDLSVVRVLCDDVAILQHGEIVETGPVARNIRLVRSMPIRASCSRRSRYLTSNPAGSTIPAHFHPPNHKDQPHDRDHQGLLSFSLPVPPARSRRR